MRTRLTLTNGLARIVATHNAPLTPRKRQEVARTLAAPGGPLERAPAPYGAAQAASCALIPHLYTLSLP